MVRGREACCAAVHGVAKRYDLAIEQQHGDFSPTLLKNLHSVLHAGITNFHSYQQCKTISFPSHPLHHLVFFFLICSEFCHTLK